MLLKKEWIEESLKEPNFEKTKSFLAEKLVPYCLLNVAAKEGNLELIKLLDSEGVDLHHEDEFAFKIACSEGHLHIVEYLASKGTNIHVENDRGLYLAFLKGDIPLVQFLIEKGLSFQQIKDRELMVQAVHMNHLELVKFLVEKGMDEESKIIGFFVACAHGFVDLVDFLGSQDNIIYDHGLAGLDLANQRNQYSVVEYFHSKKICRSACIIC